MPPAFAWFHSIESFPARISWKSIKSGSTWWFASPPRERAVAERVEVVEGEKQKQKSCGGRRRKRERPGRRQVPRLFVYRSHGTNPLLFEKSPGFFIASNKNPRGPTLYSNREIWDYNSFRESYVGNRQNVSMACPHKKAAPGKGRGSFSRLRCFFALRTGTEGNGFWAVPPEKAGAPFCGPRQNRGGAVRSSRFFSFLYFSFLYFTFLYFTLSNSVYKKGESADRNRVCVDRFTHLYIKFGKYFHPYPAV